MTKSKIAASMLIALTFSVSSAMAVPTVEWASVKKVLGGKANKLTYTTFQQPDPAYSGTKNTDGNTNVTQIASFTQISQDVNGLTGLNIPSVHGGLLPSVGQFKGIGADYSAPGSSNADTGLFFVVQTADGLYHFSPFTAPNIVGNGSINFGTANGRTKWHVFQINAANFTPAFASGTGSVITKMAVVFDGVASATSTINQLLPPAISAPKVNEYQLLTGTTGVLNNRSGSNTVADLVLRVDADSRFNFEF
ncbi:MAG: hypothetical protein JST89_06240 [Cyanobacteria bacterium SZAS-4]|nr:hypothetical protein [Cyanobacteria bacterium SZAS-4]